MKTSKYFFVGIFILLVTSVSQVYAQSDNFAGKWTVLVKDTPYGDAEMVVNLNRVDGKLTGTVAPDGEETTKITSTEETEKSITIYFESSGYDVGIYLEKKGDNEAAGTMMGMFAATAKRSVE
jgi:hypothetical protein